MPGWEPLPLIVYGYAVHPLVPASRRDTRYSTRTRHSAVSERYADDRLRDVVSLEVGDEIYGFEQYVPKGKEVDGKWYRGYVVTSTRRPPTNWQALADPSSNASWEQMSDETQVILGIFPASHIHVREYFPDAENRLAAITLAFEKSLQAMNNGNGHEHMQDLVSAIGRSSKQQLRDDEDDTMTRKSFRIAPPREQKSSSQRAALTVYPPSIRSRSSSPSPTENGLGSSNKPHPPRPILKSSDETASGVAQPLVDEIASAIREWHHLLYRHLARRDYRLFAAVRDHINALHLGRRQLIAQTLSETETQALRRTCIARLVRGNIIQGLDIIVRHPVWGGLVTVSTEVDSDPRSWMTAIRMYALSVSLAFIETRVETVATAVALKSRLSCDTISYGSASTPAKSSFPEIAMLRGSSLRGEASAFDGSENDPKTRKLPQFYHVFIEVRAFVASLCAPGETAELFFSLYNKSAEHFMTEDFCAVLNHNGVLARNPSAKIRALFVDLVPSEALDTIYLVCRIVRNGGLKLGNTFSTGAPDTPSIARSASQASFNDHDTSSSPTHILNSAGRLVTLNDSPFNFRRPFGCAVLELTQLSALAGEGGSMSSTREHTLPIWVPSQESAFAMIHNDVIAHNTRELEKSPRAEGVAVSVKIFHGDADTVVREHSSLLQDVPLTLRLGFPDVVFPGVQRNEVYVKLWSGDFSSAPAGGSRLSMVSIRGNMGAPANNIEVTVEVRDKHGRTVQEPVISMGTGEPGMTSFRSMIFQRNNTPTFGELFKIHLPTSGQAGWHLFLTLRKRASNEGRNNGRINEADRPFAFGYLPLFPRDRTFLEDGGHTLVLYRADKLASISSISADMYLSATPCHAQGQRSEQINISPEMQRLAPPLRDTISVRTSLTSTRLTQEPFLASLLDWRHSIRDQEQLETMLGKFVFVAETDIVKFLGDIFDALFGILSAPVGSHGKTGVLVLKCLVTVLGIVQDRRFSNFLPVLDVYIQRHYDHPDAGLRIVHAFNHLIADPSPEAASSLRSALKVWNYLFKFIVRSLTLLRTRSTPAGDAAVSIDEDYRDALSTHLDVINKLMALSTPPSVIGTQTIALQHFTSIFPQLNQIFPTDELVDIAISFMRANPTNKGKIVIWKLIALLHFVKGFLFDEVGPRARLVEETVIWIKPYFGRFDEYAQAQEGENAIDLARVQWLESSRLCVTIIAVMLDKLQQCLVDPAIASDPKKLRAETDNVELIAPLLPRLFATYQEFASPTSHEAIRRSRQPHLVASGPPVTFPESYPFSLIARMPSQSPSTADKRDSLSTLEGALFNVGLGETATVILVIACSAPKAGLQDWLSQTLEIEGKDNMTALLNQTFSVAQSILDNEAFPKNWLNMNIFAHVALIRLMDAVADTLEQQYIPVDDTPLDATLWRAAISTLLQLLSSEQLVIEELSPQRGRSVWRLAGDIRGDGGAILYHLWNALGMPEALSAQYGAVGRFWGHQAALGNLVDQVVHLCMSHHDQLRLHAVQILYNMIMTDYHTLENFTRIENEVVNKLDTLFTEKSQGDETSRSFFITQLRALFESSNTDERLRDRVNEFLESVDSFLDLLLSVRALPEGEEFADDRVIATLRLMNYLRRSGRDEMYIKYVHQLVNMHIQSSNHVEAALTLQLHADLHDWDLHSFVPAMEDLGLPRQSQFHRKETLCLLILDYLGKGKAWEKAIDLCKELAYQHQEVSYNYGRLSEILKYQAMLLEHIVTEQRYYPEYFRVTFFGNFPAAVRHKSIVYRGFDWEKLGAFCDRMLQKHPGAQILKGAGDPPPDVRFGSAQYIQILGVKPEPNKDLPIFSNPNVPVQVKAYYEHNATNLFSFSRPLTKHARDGSEEVWTEKTYLTTEAAFPTVLRRSEVVQSQPIYISPVESALADLEEKTRELAGLYMRYSAVAQTGQAVPTNQFSMTLNASVDVAGDAGVNLYRRTFLAPEYLQLWPDRLSQVEMLRKVVDEHVMTLETCLRLHGRVCPPEMLPFHETLEGDFRRNFKPEIQRLAADGLSEFDYANSISPSTASNHELLASVYPGASKASSRYSVSSGSTSRAPFMIPPLQLGASSPVSPSINSHQMFSQELLSDDASSRPTPLKKSLQHLAKHGLTGVSSSTREPASPASEAQSVNSPKGSSSFINFVPAPTMAAAPATSGSGSNSIRSRLSRLGNSIRGRD